MLGPLLFAIYISPISNIIAARDLCYHQYAETLSCTCPFDLAVPQIHSGHSHCVDDVCRWFLENRLLLNPSKTEAVLFSTCIQRDMVPTSGDIDVTGTLVPFHDTVKLLGVTLDSALTMDHHVTEVYAAATVTYGHCGTSDRY